MKKFISIFSTIVMLAIVGCSALQFKSPEMENLAIKIAAKHLAYELAYKHPKIIKDGIELCTEILKADNSNNTTLYLFNVAAKVLAKEIKNEVLRSDYQDLLSMVTVDNVVNLNQAIFAVQGFKLGLELRAN